jgi:small subunit ribosomal protein S21
MEQNKKPYKKVRKEEMEIIGKPMAVKVINNQVEAAIKLWKRKIKESGKLEELRDRKEFLKPSVIKRKNREEAIRKEVRNRRFQ